MRTGTGCGRFGNVMVHPVVSDVAFSTYRVVVVSAPLSGLEVTFHRPATSARESVLAVAAGSVAPAALSVASSRSLVAQATRPTRQQLKARIRMGPSTNCERANLSFTGDNSQPKPRDDAVGYLRRGKARVVDAEIVESSVEDAARIQLIFGVEIQQLLAGCSEIALERLLGETELGLVAPESFFLEDPSAKLTDEAMKWRTAVRKEPQRQIDGVVVVK